MSTAETWVFVSIWKRQMSPSTFKKRCGSAPDNDTIGIVRGDSETWRDIPDAIAVRSEFDVNRIRLMVGGKTLLGAIVMGDQKLSQPIHQLVVRQVDITPIRAQLLVPDVRVGEVIAEFWGKARG